MLSAAMVAAAAVTVFALGVGDVENTLILPKGDHPEGVAMDRNGDLFVGNRYYTSGGLASELRRITPDGSTDTVIATFAPSPTNALLGLVVDDDGDVWAAVDGGDDHGVWRVSANGKHKKRIPGSEDMDFPNALTFDAEGNLYVTDSGPVGFDDEPVGGAVWRLEKGAKTMELWSDDPALAPLQSNPLGGHPPGANGIAYFPPDSIYVANTEKGQIFRIPILADGSAGNAEPVTTFFGVPTVDGIAVDVHGDIYAALPGHAHLPYAGLPGPPPVVRVDPATGVVERVTLDAYDGMFDVPVSLAFDTRPGQRTNLYVTNADLALLGLDLGPGPRVVRANVGEPGFYVK